MTPDQQVLVRTTFAKVVPIADTAATLFYDDLFRRDPRLRRLFRDDMAEQRRKLMQMLSVVVAHVGAWEQISAAVRALGQRHRGYGVVPSDYETVGAALIATLEQGLGADFTPEARDAWQACIGVIAGDMLHTASV